MGIQDRARVWLRERKERAEERRRLKQKHLAPNAAPIVWVWFLAIIAAATLIGSTWMLVVFIAGSVGHVDWAINWRAGNDGEPSRWQWFAAANIHMLIGVGLFLFCIGIACFNAVWLHVRHFLFGLFRHAVTGIGAAVALFMITGAVVVQQWGTDARVRDQVTATNTALAGVAAINAEIAAIEREMERLCAPALTTYQAQACRSGEQAWQGRIAIARQQRDYQQAGIERAIVDAQQGDRWRARLLELRQQAAVSSITAVEAQAATVEATGWMATFTNFLEDIRKPFVAVLGELLAMTMFGVALAAWRSRRHTVEQSGWAPEDHRIEDLRAEEPVVPQPMKPAREVVTDAETGEELVKVKPHWRKLKKGKRQQVDIQPEIPPDEVGVETDGGNRIGTIIAGMTDLGTINKPNDRIDDGNNANSRDNPQAEPDVSRGDATHPEPPVDVELTDEETLALFADEAQASDEQQPVSNEVGGEQGPLSEQDAAAHLATTQEESGERDEQYGHDIEDTQPQDQSADADEHVVEGAPTHSQSPISEQVADDDADANGNDEVADDSGDDQHVRPRALISAK